MVGNLVQPGLLSQVFVPLAADPSAQVQASQWQMRSGGTSFVLARIYVYGRDCIPLLDADEGQGS
jgi:hypothetical protein